MYPKKSQSNRGAILDKLDDVLIRDPANGDTLTYNATTRQWENNDGASGVAAGTYNCPVITVDGGGHITDAITTITTKGDLIGYSSAPTRLAIGSNDQLLVADSAAATGLKWASLPATYAYTGPNIITVFNQNKPVSDIAASSSGVLVLSSSNFSFTKSTRFIIHCHCRIFCTSNQGQRFDISFFDVTNSLAVVPAFSFTGSTDNTANVSFSHTEYVSSGFFTGRNYRVDLRWYTNGTDATWSSVSDTISGLSSPRNPIDLILVEY